MYPHIWKGDTLPKVNGYKCLTSTFVYHISFAK